MTQGIHSRSTSHFPHHSAFHKNELARMQHAHSLAGSNTVTQRGTLPGAVSATVELPPLKRHNPSSLLRVCRYPDMCCDSIPGVIIDWKSSLRRDMVVPRRTPRTHPTWDQSRVNKVNRAKISFVASETQDPVPDLPKDVAWQVNQVERPKRIESENEIVPTTFENKEERAMETLQSLFLPRWRLYMHLKRRRARPVRLCPVAPRIPSQRFSRVRNEAVNIILSLLRSEWLLPLVEFRRLKEMVVKIQRAYRRHKIRMDARVELNYRKLRADLEEKYWKEVADMWDDDAKRGDFLLIDEREEYEADVANFALAGRLPEVFLRRELRNALHCHMLRHVRQPIAPSEKVFFLPFSMYYAVLDNVCYITSVIRDSKMLRSHLSIRKKMISRY